MKKMYVGTCVEVGERDDLPWDDASEMSNDLGYYATFDDFEDPEDSNYFEIDKDEFDQSVNMIDYEPQHSYIYLKRYDDSIFIAYDEDEDIHYIYE